MVVDLGWPEPYDPPKRAGGAYANSAERATMLAGFDRRRRNKMRIVIGVSPYAPPEFVKQHPEWRLKATADEKPLDFAGGGGSDQQNQRADTQCDAKTD